MKTAEIQIDLVTNTDEKELIRITVNDYAGNASYALLGSDEAFKVGTAMIRAAAILETGGTMHGETIQ